MKRERLLTPLNYSFLICHIFFSVNELLNFISVFMDFGRATQVSQLLFIDLKLMRRLKTAFMIHITLFLINS